MACFSTGARLLNSDVCLDSGRLDGENAPDPRMPFFGLRGGVDAVIGECAVAVADLGCRSVFPAFASRNSSITNSWLSRRDNQFRKSSSNLSLLDGNFEATLISFPICIDGYAARSVIARNHDVSRVTAPFRAHHPPSVSDRSPSAPRFERSPSGRTCTCKFFDMLQTVRVRISNFLKISRARSTSTTTVARCVAFGRAVARMHVDVESTLSRGDASARRVAR